MKRNANMSGNDYCTCSLFLYICRIKTKISICTNMNAKEIAIIEAIIDKSNKKRHEKALKLLLYGEDKDGSFIKNEYVNCLESLVRKKFDKSISFEDSYSTFATEFWMHLENMAPDQLRNIKDLKPWLFIVAKNFIETIRKEIEAFQLFSTPIDEDRLTGIIDDDPQGDTNELNNEAENDSEENKGNEEQIPSQEVESTEMIPFDESEQERQKRLSFAQWRFQYYLSKMMNETYKDILSAVYIEGVDRVTLAEDYGWGMDVFNLTLDHARNAFISVALEDIRHCEPNLFREYECHKDMDDKTASLLRDFFVLKYDVQQLALLHHKSNYEIKKTLAVAYKKLLGIHKKETELMEAERNQKERKHKRKKRLYVTHKGILEKEFPLSYKLLLKYFEEFNGDFSAMTEWALNNNISVIELERQLETSFDVLNAIEKDRSIKKRRNLH